MVGRVPSNVLPGDRGYSSGEFDYRWTPARKEEVLRRLDTGAIGLNDALRLWHLTLEEVEAWRRAHPVYGKRALRIGARPAGEAPAQGTLL